MNLLRVHTQQYIHTFFRRRKHLPGLVKAYVPRTYMRLASLFWQEGIVSKQSHSQPPTMTAVGLRHVAAAAAFLIATSTVVQHANASTSSGCDFTESPPCSECLPCADPHVPGLAMLFVGVARATC